MGLEIEVGGWIEFGERVMGLEVVMIFDFGRVIE